MVTEEKRQAPKVKRKQRPKKRVGSAKTAEANKMFRLRLYVTGQTPRSVASVQNLREVCDQLLAGRFELEVIDIYQQPDLAREAHIIAVPTLVKRLPLPFRTLVGDLSDRQQVMLGLDIRPEEPSQDA
jgi:circadian clock protein KaiB